MPNMMLKGINEFYESKEMQDEQRYEWIKDEKVIYIPKSGRAIDPYQCAKHFIK